MDFDPNNWYPEPVPMWNLQTPTIFVPPSPTLVNPPLSPPPHFLSHSIPPIQSPAFIPNPAAVQSCIDAFAVFQQGMNEASNDFRENMQKIQESLQQSRRLIRELRTKVPTASAASYSGPQYAPEDPTLPSPWRGLIDGSTGSIYYWNTTTNQTQYEKPCPLTHPPLAHPTQPIYLHRKQLRVLRRRVSMAATRRLFKATGKPDLLSTLGKAPRTQVNCKKGLWAKAQNGYLFSEILEAIRRHCMGTETSTTNPSSPLIFDVPEQQEVLHSRPVSTLVDEIEKLGQTLSVTVPETISLSSPSLNRADVVVPNDIQPSFAVSGLSDPVLQFRTLSSSSTTSWSQASGTKTEGIIHTEHDSLGAITVSVTGNVHKEKTSGVLSKYGEFCHSSQHPRVGAGYSSEMNEFNIFDVKSFIAVSITRGGKFTSFGSNDVITPFFSSTLQQYGHEGFRKPVMVKVCVVPSIHLLNMFLLCDASCVIPLKDVFQKLPRNCVVSWTSLIGHCASQGHKVDAALLFSMIEAKGIPPNTFTLLVVLTACKRSGLVDDGRKRLENMIKAYSLVPSVQLYACVVDLFGRTGCLLEAMTTRTTPKKQLSKHKFSLGISEANLESHMLEVTQMEFILKIRGRIQLPLDRFIRELKLGDLEKAQLDLKATTHGAPLFASGTPPIIIYALKAFLLEFESHLNSEMIDFEVLADDYRYWKMTLNGYALFQNIQWSEMHVLHAAELPKFLPAYLNTFTCYVAADTLLAHESLTRVPESYHSVLALQLGFFLKLHICSVATVSLLLPLVRVIKWPNQDSSYVPVRGATHVLLQGAAIRFVLVVVPNMYHACTDNDFSRHLGIVIAYTQLNFEGEKSSKTMTEAFKVGETPRKGQQVQVLAVFIIRQPITLLQWVYLWTLDHATLPNALCFSLLQLHSYLHELGLFTHMHELNYLFMTSWAYIICALLLSATTTGMEDSTRELSFLRYNYAPPLLRDYGVFPLTYMNKCFPYMVSHVHQDMFLKVTHSSTFYSPFYALVRKLVPLSLMAAIQLLGSLLANILRDHYIIGILVLKSIIQLVSLKSIQHGLEVSYGAISTGNYSSHVSCLIYFPEFMNTWDWVIDFGFVAIDFGYLALIPSLHLSLPTRSIEALLLFVWPTIMHCQIVELVISCTLLQSPNGDTTLLHSTCDFKADVIPLVPDFIVIWLNITVSDRFWGAMAKRDTATATQGRSGVFMQLKLHYFELLELVKTPTNSSPSTSYLLQFLSKTWSQVILPFFAYTLIPWLVLLDASVDCSFPKKLGSEEKVACADITKGSPKVNDSVAEGVLQCLEEILMQYLLVFVYQMVVVLTMLTYGALFSSFDSSEEIPLGVTKCFRALLLKFFACSFKSCTYDLQSLVLGSRSIVANDKIMEVIVREDNPSAGFTCFLLIDLYNNTADVKELKSYCQDASRINAKSIPGIPTASVTSGLTDIAATSITSLNELKQTVELLQKPFKLPTDDPGQQILKLSSLRTSLFSRGEDLLGSYLFTWTTQWAWASQIDQLVNGMSYWIRVML